MHFYKAEGEGVATRGRGRRGSLRTGRCRNACCARVLRMSPSSDRQSCRAPRDRERPLLRLSSAELYHFYPDSADDNFKTTINILISAEREKHGFSAIQRPALEADDSRDLGNWLQGFPPWEVPDGITRLGAAAGRCGLSRGDAARLTPHRSRPL